MRLSKPFVLGISLLLTLGNLYAEPKSIAPGLINPQAKPALAPSFIPNPPTLDVSSYVLMDASTGAVLAEKNSEARLEPASLTKMMTMYLISDALKNGQLRLDDQVYISKKAWQMGGSKMFVQVNQKVPVEDLVKGIVVVSGNDACIAMAEHLAGSEEAFASVMNDKAKLLGMKNSHFMDSTGMPNAQHYTTAKDLAILGRSLVTNFPDYYQRWYSTKWYTYNNIRQPNRNRLLWRDDAVDGIKTGHTDSAGFCLVSSAHKNNMRLIAVVMGAKNDSERTESSQNLLNYGFRFYETHSLYKSGVALVEARTWMGRQRMIQAGLNEDIKLTIPSGSYKNLKAQANLDPALRAPIAKGQKLGHFTIMLNDKVLADTPLIAMEENPKGGALGRLKDFISLSWYKMWHKADGNV